MIRRERTREIAKIVALVLSFLVFARCATSKAHAEVITVCPEGGDFVSIQSTVDEVNQGDTVTLCSVAYAEAISFDKDLIPREESQVIATVSSQNMPSVVSRSPGATITLVDLIIIQEDDSASDSINAASVEPYTGTITITNTLNLTGTDQVTTIINGDVSGNVAIVQANTKVFVVNVTFSLPSSEPDSIAPLADDELASLADAVLQSMFSDVTSPALQGADQVTATVNGDVSGNVVIVQANTTIDVINLTVSLFADGAILSTNPSVADVKPRGQSHVLFIPLINR